MNNSLLGSWIKRFLLEYLITVKNLSFNTQHCYRDTFCLLIPFLARQAKKAIDQLTVEDVSPERVKFFLLDLEQQRHCSITTRNLRLAAIHSLAQFIGINSPEHLHWCSTIKAIPSKKAPCSTITYLEKSEMDALLAAAEGTSALQRRDHALLLFLYNTGARVDEVAHLIINDLTITQSPHRDYSSTLIHGKGNKTRHCPLWKQTINEILPLIKDRQKTDRVFINRCGQPITRFGIHTIVERYATIASVQIPSLKTKRVSPHTIRHTSATHLLRAGVDINTIRAWLGHVSVNTTSIYAEIDLEMKAKALALCEVQQTQKAMRPKDDPNLMSFLRSL
ncbi:MAG: tyrosine-type recombinase/integrase [Endomicrobiales bacterium]|jgi:site-specific recombinase XerD